MHEHLNTDKIPQRIGWTTYLEFVLFETLTRHPFQVLRHEQLLEIVQGTSSRGRKASSRGTLTKDMGCLRAKFVRAGVPCIKTMYGVGYGFIPPAPHGPRRSLSARDVDFTLPRAEAR